MERPDFVVCVRLGRGDKPRESWCGQQVSGGWHFTDATHALLNAAQGGRLAICPECSTAMRAALDAGTWHPAVTS